MNIDNDWFYIRETFVDNTLYEFIIPLENNHIYRTSISNSCLSINKRTC